MVTVVHRAHIRKRHAEFDSASDCVVTVMLNVIQHLETLKQVQGDRVRERDPETSSG